MQTKLSNCRTVFPYSQCDFHGLSRYYRSSFWRLFRCISNQRSFHLIALSYQKLRHVLFLQVSKHLVYPLATQYDCPCRNTNFSISMQVVMLNSLLKKPLKCRKQRLNWNRDMVIPVIGAKHKPFASVTIYTTYSISHEICTCVLLPCFVLCTWLYYRSRCISANCLP